MITILIQIDKRRKCRRKETKAQGLFLLSKLKNTDVWWLLPSVEWSFSKSFKRVSSKCLSNFKPTQMSFFNLSSNLSENSWQSLGSRSNLKESTPFNTAMISNIAFDDIINILISRTNLTSISFYVLFYCFWSFINNSIDIK